MENATNALVIAGSILIVIMIIGISVFIFNITKDPVSRTVDNMNKEERTFFNSKFQQYEGGRVAGLEAKALINIAMQNAHNQLFLEEKPRIPEIYYEAELGKLPLTLTRAAIESTDNPETYRQNFQNMLNKTNNTSFYSIEITLNAKNGIVSKIDIKKLDI